MYPVQGNIVFVKFPRLYHQIAHQAGANYYLWPFHQKLEGNPDEKLSARFVASWANKDNHLQQLADAFAL